jgi:hypothetical protein
MTEAGRRASIFLHELSEDRTCVRVLLVRDRAHPEPGAQDHAPRVPRRFLVGDERRVFAISASFGQHRPGDGEARSLLRELPLAVGQCVHQSETVRPLRAVRGSDAVREQVEDEHEGVDDREVLRVFDEASITGSSANISAFMAGPAAVTTSRFAR